MPTLKNNGSHVHVIERIDGAMVAVAPGEIIETYSAAAVALAGMTLVSPEPHFNPAIERSDLGSAGPRDDRTVTIDPDAESIEIINNSVTAEITVYLDSVANTPGLKVVQQSRRTIDGLKGKVARLVLRFSGAVADGECFVTQLR